MSQCLSKHIDDKNELYSYIIKIYVIISNQSSNPTDNVSSDKLNIGVGDETIN